MRAFSILPIIATAVVATASASAQVSDIVTMSGERLPDVSLHELDGDTAIVYAPQRMKIPVENIRSIRVRSGSRVSEGALAGLFAGMLAGIVWEVAATGSLRTLDAFFDEDIQLAPGEEKPWRIATAMLGGLGIGALVGLGTPAYESNVFGTTDATRSAEVERIFRNAGARVVMPPADPPR